MVPLPSPPLLPPPLRRVSCVFILPFVIVAAVASGAFAFVPNSHDVVPLEPLLAASRTMTASRRHNICTTSRSSSRVVNSGRTPTTRTDGTSRPTASTCSSKSLSLDDSSLLDDSCLPQMIIFDLDNTLWTPELYQLRSLQRQKNAMPRAGIDVDLFPGARAVIDSIRSDEGGRWSNVRFAVASRTKSVEWAHHLLDQFGIRDIFDHVEIFPGDKIAHFNNLREKSGIPFERMIFFDDARHGRYGNCVPVSRLGVLSVHTPGGLHCETIFHTAMERFATWDGRPSTVVEHDGSVTELPHEEDDNLSNERRTGKVAKFFDERGFGFIRYGDRGTKDLFFHMRSLMSDTEVIDVGDEVSFVVRNDKKTGKKMAAEVQSVKAGSSDAESVTNSDDNTVDMRVFSMNNPFAALLANGHKTLETRNGTMFVPYPEGTKFLLHVGRRIYPDGDRHIDVMKSGGLSDAAINKLKSLPQGYGRGQAVAILEIGKTFETTLAERSEPDFQRRVCAFGEDSGRRATEIRRVEYLKRPVRVSGQGGVFKAKIPRDAIPSGWLSEKKDGVSGGRVVYSISG
mmetsp:Transcript_12610/g.26073  ORF Transcript_12610/g.26073 Transcript_12610/m.26073 type:complete len:569 (-) Transcript_12610:544-2250(-)